MDNKEFIELCIKSVADYVNKRVDRSDRTQITEQDVYVVWSCKTLQNNKALLSTMLLDGMYYECTFNGDKNELYLDAYKKWENKLITL